MHDKEPVQEGAKKKSYLVSLMGGEIVISSTEEGSDESEFENMQGVDSATREDMPP